MTLSNLVFRFRKALRGFILADDLTDGALLTANTETKTIQSAETVHADTADEATTATNALSFGGHAASYFQTAFNKEEFSAFRKSNQSFSASTWTKAQFNFEDFDPYSRYNTSTNRYTVVNAGLYHLFTHAELATGTYTGNVVFAISIYKNGAQQKVSWERFYVSSAAAVHTPEISLLDQASSGDYYEVYVYCSLNATLYSYAASNFAGYRIS